MTARGAKRAGSQIAPGYEVLEHLHRSNMFDVYDCWSVDRESRCIVKGLRPERRAETGPSRRLLREGRLLVELCHPGIVRGYEVLRRPEPLVVMETLTGETLAHMVDRRGRLTAHELAFLGLHLTAAVGYLHRHGYVHLDLKPSNVVAESGRAKLIDLSLARRPGRARPGQGTWCYLAPEQANGGAVGEPADVWGVGVVLWEAACGDTPFADESVEYPQLEHRAPALGSRRRLPRPLAAAVDGCLDSEPDRRPTLAAVRAAFEQVAGERG